MRFDEFWVWVETGVIALVFGLLVYLFLYVILTP